MAKITAADVNKLRKLTGAGMMDCKKALVEADGDFEQAIVLLRKKGQKIAANRADRDSSEGAAIAKINSAENKGVIVSLNCETDFVAKNQDFINLANRMAEIALNCSDKEGLMKADIDGLTVEEKLIEQTGVIGEKIEIGAFEVLEAPFVGGYIHAGNKIASLVGLSANVGGAGEVAKDVSMQVAAMNPVSLDENSVPQEIIDREMEIAMDQVKKEGKPENMWDQIAKGKLNRFFKDSTLVHQSFIKDNKSSVADYVKTLGGDIKVTGFRRVSLG